MPLVTIDGVFHPENVDIDRELLRKRAEKNGVRFVDKWFDKLIYERGLMEVVYLSNQMLRIYEEIKIAEKRSGNE